MIAAAEVIKACCAAAYASPAVRWLLGESFHPGGAELTDKLVRALAVGGSHTVVDVACGPGGSSLRLARKTGARVVGVDLSPDSVRAATRAAEEAGLADTVRFVVGDAEALPLGDASADGVLCECAFCTFPDKPTAAAELARVLRPGGRLALADVTADPERLPPALRTLDGWVACLADARPLAELAELVQGAGFAVEIVERHDDALARLLDRVDARLRLARTGLASPAPSAPIERGIELVATARESLERGVLGYAAIVARRRATRPDATESPVSASNLV